MRSLEVYHLVKRREKRQARLSYSLHRRVELGGFTFGALAAIVLAATLVLLGFAYASLTSDLPSVAQLPLMLDPEQGTLMQPTRLYDRSGDKLLLVLENPNIPRRYLRIDPRYPEFISPYLVQVTIALYDAEFWSHPGFRWDALLEPQPQTLPERLVGDLLLDDEADSLRRRLRMRLLAAQLVARFGRSQVLEWYFNSASYGHLAYGADSAARLYLGKPASQLNLVEAAMLAPIAEAPALNPFDTPAAALERHDEALNRLYSMGVINAQERIHAIQNPPQLVSEVTEPPQIAPAFNRMVLDQLTARFGRSRVERGGLRVTTSLDYELQLQLTCTAQTQLMRLNGQTEPPAAPDGRTCEAARLLPPIPPGATVIDAPAAASGVILDIENGQVLALLGDSTTDVHSRELSGRQPGSLLSPFVAVAAFARGLSPATLVWDIPHDDDPGRNHDGIYHGPQRLRLALVNDYLAPLTRILTQIGPANTWRLSEPLGLTLDGVQQPERLLYEGGRISPLDLAQAYSVFARQGMLVGERRGRDNRLRPVLVLKVEQQAGNTWLEESAVEVQAVLSEPLAYLVHHVFADEPARWSSLGYPNPLELGRPAGAKIGRAAGGHEVWTVGYTPQRLAIVWMGSENDVLDPTMAAGIWQAIMKHTLRDLAPAGWQAPPGVSGVVVCEPSGFLPSASCPGAVEEVFLTGHEPVEVDTLFETVQINRETNRLATVFTPLELIVQETYMKVPPEAQAWAQTAGIARPPSDYDSLYLPRLSPFATISAPEIFSYIHGMVIVRGSAYGEGFESFQLQVGQGLNPDRWLQIGETTRRPVQNGVLGRWNTRGLGGLYALRLLVVYEDRLVETAVIQVTVDNQSPEVEVFYPPEGARFDFPVNKNITLQAQIRENIEVSRVEWYINGKLVGESRQAPYLFPWTGTFGDHVLVVKAYDLAGNLGESSPVHFSMQYD
ncbi:MAG TPA: penicillin-binding protein [Levilinea sp.]|nr:penicillin-binding protein [Levilinea sp.]